MFPYQRAEQGLNPSSSIDGDCLYHQAMPEEAFFLDLFISLLFLMSKVVLCCYMAGFPLKLNLF